MPQHFAFLAPPAHGHINPTLPLVEELVRRGHRVTYATGSDHVQVVRAAGADVLPLSGAMPSPPPGGQIGPEQMGTMLQQLLADAHENFPTLLEHFGADRPDAICYDAMTLTGPMLAHRMRCAGVALVPTVATNEHFSLRETMPDSFDLNHPVVQRMQQGCRELAERFGVPVPQPVMTADPAELNLVFVPDWFQPRVETFDRRFRFLGPALSGRARRDAWHPADERAPLLFVSLGTAFNNRPDFFRTCLRAFGNSPWQVAMAVGEHIDPAELGLVPDNVEVRAFFPQPAVLAHAEVFLSHAGMNSTMESLLHAVPLVTYPQMPEQQLNADRVEQLGLGRGLAADCDATTLRRVVDDLATDTTVRAAVRRAGQRLAACDGPAAGADALEAHLAPEAAAARG